jgi:hypothetical protein
MKKQQIKSLQLNKKSIASIKGGNKPGGGNTKTFTSYWAYCPTNDVDCVSLRLTECGCTVNG